MYWQLTLLDSCTCQAGYVTVAVKFLFQLRSIFPLFLGMVMYANENKGKAKIKCNITKALPAKLMAPDWFTLTLLINFGVVV